MARCANSSQEADGLDIPSLFDNARNVLEELNSMKEDPETAADAVPINPELIPELSQLSQIAKAELNCKCHITRLSLLLSYPSTYMVLTYGSTVVNNYTHMFSRYRARDQGFTNYDLKPVR